jgi:multiple sugar transport system permease protein
VAKRLAISARGQERLGAYFLLAPDILGLLLVYVGPMLFTVYLSFFAWNGIGAKTFVGLSNYAEMLRDPVWARSLWVTFRYVLMYVPSIVVGSLLLGLMINRPARGVQLFRTIYFLPIVVPIVVASIVWQLIYEPSYGFLNYLLGAMKLPRPAWLGSERTSLFSVVLVSIWKQAGYYMLLYLAGLKEIPSEYYDASTVDGANGLQRFWYVTLPLLKPIIVFVAVVNLITALQDFDQVYVLTKGGPNYSTYVQVFYIYEKSFRYLKMGSGAAASVLLFGIIFVLSLLQLKATKGGRT